MGRTQNEDTVLPQSHKTAHIKHNSSQNSHKEASKKQGPRRQTYERPVGSHNKLKLNKFHQIEKGAGGNQIHKLLKRKRDLDRLIKHLQSKGQTIEGTLPDQLKAVQVKIADHRKQAEKEQRRDHFLEKKYQQIKTIQRRKVLTGLHQARALQPYNPQKIAQWELKLNYIKFYPKHLKYVALFPCGAGLSAEAKTFQESVMEDIRKKVAKMTKKQVQGLNENQPKSNRKIKQDNKDDFFIEAVGEAEDAGEGQAVDDQQAQLESGGDQQVQLE